MQLKKCLSTPEIINSEKFRFCFLAANHVDIVRRRLCLSGMLHNIASNIRVDEMCRNSFPSRNTAVAQFLFVLISSFIALVYSLVLNSCWCLGLIRYPLDWMFELHLIHIHSWHPVGIFRDETAGRLASDLDLNANRLKLGRLFHESVWPQWSSME